MSDMGEWVAAAVAALEPETSAVQDLSQLPHEPGLFGIHASEDVRRHLGIRSPSSLLFVGKSEDDIQQRVVGTIFAAGGTSQSTVRRSLAALLDDELDLAAVRRSSDAPPSAFALEQPGDERLTQWMLTNLRAAAWVRPADAPRLAHLQKAVRREASPPLNLADVPRPWTHLKEQRERMAESARAGAAS